MPDNIIAVNRDLKGGLDTDTDVLYISGGNYTDRVNVERNESFIGGAETGSLGNKNYTTLQPQELQQQTTRVYIETFFTGVGVGFRNSNGQLIRFAEASSPVADLTNNKLAIQNAISAFVPDLSAVFNLNFPTDNFIDITFNDASYSEWTLEVSTNTTSEFLKTRVIKEAISLTGAGSYNLIGSKEINSISIQLYTTQKNPKIRGVDISALSNVNNSVVCYVENHGLQTNESIIIANLLSTAAVFNGEWTVTVIDDFYFVLNLSDAAGILTGTPVYFGGSIYKNIYGVGAIVFQQFVPNDNIYTTTIPLRSKRFNWNTKNQIDLDVEYFNDVYSLYMQDFNNRPRVVYIYDTNENDSAIEAINPTYGTYEYEQLEFQIRLQKDFSAATVSILGQNQSGGNLASGGWRYGAILVTEELAETEITDLSEIVFTFNPSWSYNSTTPIYGTNGNTNKVNRVLIENIPASVYKFIDLIAVYIAGTGANTTATDAVVVSRTTLGPDQTSIQIDHTGNEVDTRGYILSALPSIGRPSILKAKNNVIAENRLLIANYESTEATDISDWFKSIKYSIKRSDQYTGYFETNSTLFAQPYNPEVGYQLYEWYRFYGIGEYLDGGCTDACFLFDVRFVSQDDYINSFDTDDDYRFLDTNGTDRRDFNGDEFFFYELSDTINGFDNMFQWHLEIKNVDWDYQLNGIKVKDIFKRIKICRAERVKEVLSTGYIVPTVFQSLSDNLTATTFKNLYEVNTPGFYTEARGLMSTGETAPLKYGDPDLNYKYYYGYFQSTTNPNANLEKRNVRSVVQINADANGNGTVISPPINDYLDSDRVVAYYSPDFLLGQITDKPQPQSELFILGNVGYEYQLNTKDQGASGFNTDSTFSNFNANDKNRTIKKNKVQESVVVDKDTIGILSVGSIKLRISKKISSVFYGLMAAGTYVKANGPVERSPVLYLENAIDVSSPINNPANQYQVILYALNFIRKNNKYGEVSKSNDILYINYDVENGVSSKSIFGGDVYTQRTWLKQFYPKTGPMDLIDSFYENFDTNKGLSNAFNIVSQNILNTQLRTFDKDNSTRPLFPIVYGNITTWLERQDEDQISKNSAYRVVKNQQYRYVFNVDDNNRSKFPSRIIYSELKPNGSQKDYYTVFPPAQYRDNPLNFGEIVHLDVKQGELYSIQELCYTREFLNANGRLATIESGNVTIGDASVLDRSGIRLTQLGTKHKWSYARGLTDAGTDVRCWVNSDFFVILRSGRDGTVNLTARTFMDSFMREKLRYVKDKYTPADNQGIHAVWDDIGRNFVFTARGWKNSSEWKVGKNVTVGESVIYGEEFGIPTIYVCIQDNETSEDNKPGTKGGAEFWEKIEITNSSYYSVWTLCFNEQANKFTHYHTFYPRIYATHFDHYFSPNPKLGLEGELYAHRDGEILVFYGDEHEGYSEYVINNEPSLTKKFVSIAYNSLLKPYKVELNTRFISEQGIENRLTMLDRSEFLMRENVAFSPIKNTLDSQGRNNQRTAPMKGLFLKIKTFFKAREFQKINDIFVPVRIGQRNVKNP